MKKPTIVASVDDASVVLPWVMPKALEAFPFVGEFLANPRWEDNDRKGERALMVFVSDESCVAILKVQTPALKMTAVGKGLDGAMTGLELCMVADAPPWVRDDNPLGRRKGKK